MASTPASVAFRANLAELVSPLRRVRPRVPFFQLAAHRAPTLALYRNLLRNAADANIRWRVRALFREHRHATGTEKTTRQLLKGYKWLEAFKQAREGDEKQQAILARYSRLIAAKLDKEHWKDLVRAEVAWQDRLKSRPILTGGIMKGTYFNPPLPRMKPQPTAISMMIQTRMRVRERRWARREQLLESLQTLAEEEKFEEGLLDMGEDFEPVFSAEAAKLWRFPIHQAVDHLNVLNARDIQRAETPISAELSRIILAARREKVANKTRERERERRGAIVKDTLKRKRQQPPPHLLSHMTPEERHKDRVARGVGEVGYVGMIKRRMGFKLRDGGKGLARENSLDLDGERLAQLKEMEKEYRAEQARRRREGD
ncbi:hypothetical protein C8F01DRAFT_1049494 [Mycena amicta]|nr:hypothetical protein C8F01DRAFT_1049494 [Mycena amicta]